MPLKCAPIAPKNLAAAKAGKKAEHLAWQPFSRDILEQQSSFTWRPCDDVVRRIDLLDPLRGCPSFFRQIISVATKAKQRNDRVSNVVASSWAHVCGDAPQICRDIAGRHCIEPR